MQLKSFINDMGKNAIIGISESWLTPNNKISWNVARKTQAFEMRQKFN